MMGLYKIRHALATWIDSEGTPQTGFRGQVVEIPDVEAQRLIPHEAIIGADEELVHPGILADLPASPSDEELLAWVTAANISEVTDMVTQRPELRVRIEATLKQVVALRGSEDTHLADVARAMQGLPPETNDDIKFGAPSAPTGGIEEIAGASSASTGSDDVDTSGEGDEDIHMAIPDGTAAGTLANDTPDVIASTTDYATLVTGSAEDVAAYIGDHPLEVNAVVAAEMANTNEQPRAAVIVAARAAAQFLPAGE